MKCPKCQHENSADANFCNKCATPLGEATTQDGRFSLISDYVPVELKKRIVDAGRQLESERRFVTVLFADVSGFTSLSEKLDPETVTMVMNDLFNGLITIIIKYEGLIIDFFGDGILAVFGAPLAHENDPERAIHSALDMMPYIDRFNRVSPHKLPAPLGMHIGIHSGLVVVGNVGNDMRMRYSAVGDTVNLCSRIADHATRGEIYISDNTYKLLPSQLNTEPAESVILKGKEEPVTVHKLLSINGEIIDTSAAGVKGFIGRREEKEIIVQVLSRVLDRKEERILVRGEPGVGKSRLKDEVTVTAVNKGFSVFEGKCSSFETKTPYYLWNTLLKDMLGISVEAPEDITRKQLHDTLSILNMNKEEPYLAALLSLRYEEILLEDEKERRSRIFEAMHRFIAKFSEREPTVFILEDIHWADRFSKELLKFLMQKDVLALSLFYIIFRPEYTEYKNIMNRGQLINLDRFSEEDILELIKMRLDVKEVPDELLQLLKARTEGNPFFIEESIKTLVENDFISVKRNKLTLNNDNLESGVPDTVQGVVMARIDRLEGRIRDVLLNASVIGREFSRKLIERVINDDGEVIGPLNHLKGLELIIEREEVQEFEYLFKHYMIQEVAYNTILINKRKKLHGIIANAIEEIYEDRLKGLYELLAFHYEKAEEWEKAAEYYGRAGRKVREIYTEEESKVFFDRKNYAIEKIYESKPQKNLFWRFLAKLAGTLLVIIMAAIFIPIAYGGIRFFIQIINDTSYLAENWGKILAYLILSIIYLWILIFTIFETISKFRPIKLFDLMSDRLEIVKGDNERFSIPFADIRSMEFYGRGKGFVIPKFLYKKVDEGTPLKDYKEFSTFWPNLTDLLLLAWAYDIGIGRIRQIHIIRKSGFKWLKHLKPWLHTLQKSQSYILYPSAPKEFFDQLCVAYEKWRTEKHYSFKKMIYPRIEQAVLFCVSFIVLHIGISIIVNILLAAIHGSDFNIRITAIAGLSNNISIALSSIIMIFIGAELSFHEVFRLDNLKIKFILPIIITIPGLEIITSEMDNLIIYFLPSSGHLYENLEAIYNGNIINLIAFILIMAICNETIFRGIILNGFLSRYSVKKAILVSAIFYAFTDMSPYSICSVFLMGIFLAGLYYLSKNLWLCIFANALHYFLPFFTGKILGLDIPGYVHPDFRMVSGEFKPLWLDVAGIVMLAIGIYYFIHKSKTNVKET